VFFLSVGFLIAVVAITPPRVAASILHVGGINPGNYTTIQLAVDAANPGDTIFVYSGTYHENVVIDKALELVGQDRNTTMVDGGGSSDTIYVSAAGMEIRDITVRNSGSNTGDAGIEFSNAPNCRVSNLLSNGNAAGIIVSSSDNCVIANSNASHNNEDGVYLYSSAYSIVENNTFHSNSRFGLLVEQSYGCTVRNNSADSNGLSGIQLETSDRSFVANNTASSNLVGIRVLGSFHDTVTDNRVSHNNESGVAIDYSRSAAVAGNVMTRNGVTLQGQFPEQWNSHDIDSSNTVNGNPIYYWKNTTGGTVPAGAGEVILANATAVTVENEHLDGGDIGVIIAFSSNNVIRNNTASSNNLYGVQIYYSPGNLAVNNTLDQNLVHGIYVLQSNASIIDNNTIGYNGRSGVNIYYSSADSSVTNNAISSNSPFGIEVHGSDRVVVSGNRVVGDGNGYGIYLERGNYDKILRNVIDSNQEGILTELSENVTVANNTVTDGFQGVYIKGFGENYCPNPSVYGNVVYSNIAGGIIFDLANGGKAYHNDLIDNGNQAWDYVTNAWDDGYPDGGNFWSDYTGVDQFNGPDQDIPGSDGIGDSPYIIDGNSQDRYPLMRPWNSLAPEIPPSAPRLFNATPGDYQVTLTWLSPLHNGTSPIENYTIYRGTTSGGEAFLASITPTLTYLDTSLTNGQIYYYQISAVTSVGEGIRSREVSATPFTVPSEPLDLHATAGDRNVTFTWSAPVSDGGSPVTNYTIFKGTASGSETYLTTVGNVLSYVDEGLTNGVKYYYQTAAVNAAGEGSRSDEANATPFASETPAVRAGLQEYLPIIVAAPVAPIAVSIGLFEFSRVFLLTLLAAPAYGRKMKGKEDAETRGMVRGYVMGNPGDTYSDIKRNLELNNGSLTWHLLRLEKDGLIKSKVQGTRKRYYPAKMAIPESNGVVLHNIQVKLLESVEMNPGKPIVILAEELGVSRQLATYHVRQLLQKGLISMERRGVRLRVYPIQVTRRPEALSDSDLR